MPEVRVLGPLPGLTPVAVTVSRDAEANLGTREHVGRLGSRRRVECCAAAGDVWVRGSDDGFELVTLITGVVFIGVDIEDGGDVTAGC